MSEHETLYTELTAEGRHPTHRIAILRYEAVITYVGGKSTLILFNPAVSHIYDHYTQVMNWLMPAEHQQMLNMGGMMIPEEIAGYNGVKWDAFRAYCWQQATEEDRAAAVKFFADIRAQPDSGWTEKPKTD